MEMTESKKRFSISNPSPANVSLANFLAELHPELKISAGQVHAVVANFSTWQQSPERASERDAERAAAKVERDRKEGEALLASEAKLREKLAKIEAAKKSAAKAS